MNKKVNDTSSLRCESCDKFYSSRSSLCNHVKKFHNNNLQNNNFLTTNNNFSTTNNNFLTTNEIKTYNCKYCNKVYNIQQSRWKHEQKCKSINDKNKDIELEKIKLQVVKEEKEILKLKLKLEKSNKIDNITLKKLNKKLLERHNLIKNSTVNSHNNIQNIVNNFQLVGFGKEEVVELLTHKEKKLIMNAKYGCLEKLVETIHCGKYNQC
jgi:hypothetical protein